MTTRLNLLILLLILNVTFILSQQTKKPDTLCVHKTYWDSQNGLLPWYYPEVEGKAYNHVINLASEFLLNTPSEPQTGYKMYDVLCCFEGPGLHKVGEDGAPKGIMPVHWANNPACVHAGSVHSFADKYYFYTGKREYIDMVRRMLDQQIDQG